jgi:drug/metabolite transporter (DMT)-like permease
MNKYLPATAAAATGVLVGSAIVATRFVIGQTSPASLALLRYLIGFVCLLPVLLLSQRVRFERRDLLPIGLLGIAQFGVVVTLLNYALQYIPSGRAALIFATLPLITMLLAAVLGYERVTLLKALGVLATIVGVGFVLGEQSLEPATAGSQWLATLAVLASAASGALCSVLYRPYLRKYSTLAVSVLAMLASVLALALIAAGEGFFVAPPHFSPAGWLAVGFIGLSSGVGYYLWLWALNHASATNVAVFLALSPVSATILGALALAEAPSPTALLGLLCVALGIWLAQ